MNKATKAEILDLVLNESDAVCEGCGANPREAPQDDGSPPDLDGWFIDIVQTPDCDIAQVRCPRCW